MIPFAISQSTESNRTPLRTTCSAGRNLDGDLRHVIGVEVVDGLEPEIGERQLLAPGDGREDLRVEVACTGRGRSLGRQLVS